MMTFCILVFAHLLADYPLQGQFLSDYKGENYILLLTHVGIWTGTVALAGYFIGFDVNMLDILLLFTVHLLADGMKAKGKLWYAKMDALKEGLLVDQAIHVIQILIFMLLNK